MPTYANSTINDIEHQGVRIPGNSSTTSYSFLTALPSGITQTSLSPNYNPVLSSTLYSGGSGSDTHTIATTTINYTAHIRCYGGSVNVAFNDAGITPVLKLVSGEQMTMAINNRSIIAFIFTYLEASSKVKIDIISTASIAFDI